MTSRILGCAETSEHRYMVRWESYVKHIYTTLNTDLKQWHGTAHWCYTNALSCYGNATDSLLLYNSCFQSHLYLHPIVIKGIYQNCWPTTPAPSSQSVMTFNTGSYVNRFPLWPPRGSVKLISTKLTDLVSLEQSHRKPLGIYGCGPSLASYCQLKGTPPYTPIGLWWDCSNDTWSNWICCCKRTFYSNN